MTFLLSVTIKTVVLVAGALAATSLLRRRSAAIRHWVLASAMLACACIPPLDLLLPAWSIPLPPGWSKAEVVSSLSFVSEPESAPAGVQSPQSAANGSSRPLLPPAIVLGSIWVIGVAIGIGVLVAGLVRLRAIALDSSPVSAGPWRDVADEISKSYGVRRAVRLLLCRHPTMLATWGMVGPTILLPDGAHAWGKDRIRAVLHHELAHVVRGDWAIALIASLLRALYWFNPLLWIACRRLRRESERACDDLVLASGISGSDYATQLLDLARESAQGRYRWSPAIAIAHRSMLEGRVRAVLNARVNRQPLTVFVRATTVALLAALTVSIAAATISGRTEVASSSDVRLVASGAMPILSTRSESPPSESRPARASAPAAQAAATGTIEGVLYDPFGGLLPGASVRLTAVGTGGSQTAFTDRGGAFVFKDLAPGDYELVTELPGFTTVKNVLHATPGETVRRHLTLPLGTVQETIHVTCRGSNLLSSRPTAPAGSATPGPAQRQGATGQRGTEPKIPATFTGGIGGQIKAPTKLSHTNPICPTGVPAQPAVVRLAGRIGIDGLFTDLHDLSSDVNPAYIASALEASRKWVFTPTLLNGAPIETNISVTISYNWSN
jgi:beta-lactamase regulating signal transducer with metallopeptidase domain